MGSGGGGGAERPIVVFRERERIGAMHYRVIFVRSRFDWKMGLLVARADREEILEVIDMVGVGFA